MYVFFSGRALLFSDDEEDTKRVVRSAKDKRLVNIHKMTAASQRNWH